MLTFDIEERIQTIQAIISTWFTRLNSIKSELWSHKKLLSASTVVPYARMVVALASRYITIEIKSFGESFFC